jgi:hypothetical protein
VLLFVVVVTSDGETVAIITVLQLPPNESYNQNKNNVCHTKQTKHTTTTTTTNLQQSCELAISIRNMRNRTAFTQRIDAIAQCQ